MKLAGGIAVVGATAAVLYTAQSHMPSGSFLATSASHLQQEYAKYLAQHGKNYLTEEEFEVRFQNFAKTHYEIETHNSKNASYTLGHNFMSDWTEKEKKSLNGFKPRARAQVSEPLPVDEELGATDFNWKHLKSVSHVKNQGQCGSCWAFSTTGSIESHTEIAHGNYTPLSEQQLVDCSTQNNGCNGGLFDYAFSYAASKGLESESDYPYQAADGWCQYSADKVANHDVDSWSPYNDVTPYDSAQVLAYLKKGPVSVAIQANQSVFQQYWGGVIPNDGSCGEELDHAVLAVGWGVESGKKYLLIKNSWGPSWGDAGFVKLEYGANSAACGVVDQPSFVNVN